LTRLDLTPDLAELEGQCGRHVTFYFEAKRGFHDGQAVAARDVVYSWARCQPASHRILLTYIGDIVGVRQDKANRSSLD
jgi:ABC-type transport system substrate-binding protein